MLYPLSYEDKLVDPEGVEPSGLGGTLALTQLAPRHGPSILRVNLPLILPGSRRAQDTFSAPEPAVSGVRC